MKRILVPILCLMLAACSDSGSGGGAIGSVLAPALKDATVADLSGQDSVFVGTLGSGMTFTFPAVRNQNYLIQFNSTDSDDEVTFDVAGDDGAGLRSKSVDSGDGFLYNMVRAIAGTLTFPDIFASFAAP